jgi:integrase
VPASPKSSEPRGIQFDREAGVWTKPSAHTKQKRQHRVPLSPACLAILDELWELKASDIYVFPGNKPGQPLRDIKNFWKRVCRQAGLSSLRIHDLRHTYASHLVSGGGDLYVVGKLLGHTQAQTTRRYAHLADNPLRQLATEFGLKVDGAGKLRTVEIQGEHDASPLEEAPAAGGATSR